MKPEISEGISAVSFCFAVCLITFIIGTGAVDLQIAYGQDLEPQKVNEYYSVGYKTLANGVVLEEGIINGPPTPPPGFELQRQAVLLLEPDVAAAAQSLTVPAYDWVFGCSAVSGAMIAAYYDRNDFPDMYTGPTDSGVMPLDNSSWPTWSDGYATYPNCPLIVSKNGVDGRTTNGSIDNYWVKYDSSAEDPYITNGWTEHTWGDAIGDYMKTSQSAYGNTDGSTAFWSYDSSVQLTCTDMVGAGVSDTDGTYGRKLFYEVRGYTVSDCYNQKTDNQVTGGFSYIDYKAEIDAGHPVMLNLVGHTVVGVGYDDSTDTVYLHDTWDYNTHSMTWGGSYSGMDLYSVSIVHLVVSSYTLTVSKNGSGTVSSLPSGINCGSTCSGTFEENSSVILSATAATGSTFAGWSDDCSGTGDCSITMDNDHSVTATFTVNTYSVSASAGANGSLDSGTLSPQTVDYGDTAQFTFNAATNYHVASVSGCGVAYSNTSNTVSSYTATTDPVTSSCTVSATFAINQYSVSASAGANGSLDSGTLSPQTVDYGDTAQFTFNAATNYHVASVSGCGVAYSNTSNTVSSYTATTDPVTSSCTVSATFAINQYSVSASAGANGSLDSGTPSPQTVDYGDTVQFIFNAATNYHVTSVSGCGVAYSNTSNTVSSYAATTDPVALSCTVSATFAINQYSVSASAGANGSLGSGTPSPQTIDYGDTAQFTFNAATNYHVASVSGCGVAYSNTSNTVSSYTATTDPVASSCTVSATFAINQYSVSASAGANGSLGSGTPSPQTIDYGDTAQFTFNAATNYHVASVSGCGVAYSNTSNTVSSYTATTDPVASSCTVSATFAINQYSITASPGANGSLDGGTPSPQTVDSGDIAQFTFNADVGYYITSITGCGIKYQNGVNLVTTRSVITDPVTADCTVSATFSVHRFQLTLTVEGNGEVTSDTGEIECYGVCSGSYDYNTTVILTVTPKSGWEFLGWSGDEDCEDGVVTMTTDVNCTAEFYNFPWNMFLPAIIGQRNQ